MPRVIIYAEVDFIHPEDEAMSMSFSARHLLRIGAFALLGMGIAQTASAQEGSCACNVPLMQPGAQVGQVSALTGNVRTAVSSGYRAASPGTALYSGTRVLVGPASSASLAFDGGCSLTVEENSAINITPGQSALCVAVSGRTLPGNAVTASNIPAYLFLGLAGSAAILSATADSDRRSISR